MDTLLIERIPYAIREIAADRFTRADRRVKEL